MQGVRRWSAYAYDPAGIRALPVVLNSFKAPFAVDLRVNFDWKVSGRVTLFAEGRNLADRDLYEYPWYPGQGAGFTVGVKANF